MERAGRKVITLSVGMPDYPPPPSVVQAIVQCVQREPLAFAYTPIAGIHSLREAIAGHIKYETISSRWFYAFNCD